MLIYSYLVRFVIICSLKRMHFFPSFILLSVSQASILDASILKRGRNCALSVFFFKWKTTMLQQELKLL